LHLGKAENRKEIEQELTRHAEDFAERDLVEERRLCYVALTRSARTLLVSAHWWGRTGSRPKGPSPFFTDLASTVDLEHLAEEPEPDAENPLLAITKSAVWPVDPLGDRRTGVIDGARLVREELETLDKAPGGQLPLADDPEGWVRDTDVL